MQHPNWTCPKCANATFSTGEMRAAGSGLASVFDFEDRRFTSVTCRRCKYTEFYQGSERNLTQLLDFLTT